MPKKPTSRVRPVMLVDDDRHVRDSLAWALRAYGYGVVAADDGEEALMLLNAGLQPCLIILDGEMPRMDGYEFRRRQQQDPRLSRIPVIFYSGDVTGARRVQMMGAQHFKKPGDLAKLLALVEHHCVPYPGAGMSP